MKIVLEVGGLHAKRYEDAMLASSMSSDIYIHATHSKLYSSEHLPSPPPKTKLTDVVTLLWIETKDTLSKYIERMNNMDAFAVQRVYIVNDISQSLNDLEEVIEREERTYRLNVFPRCRLKEVGDKLISDGFQVHPTDYTHMLSIIFDGDSSFHWGICERDVNSILLGNLFNAQVKRRERVCRAVYKLDAALEWTGIKILPDWHVGDIGAAPGGWSLALSKVAKLVHAVDPGDLTLDPMPSNIIHWKAKINDVLDDIKSHGLLHLVCIDINCHPRESATLVNNLSPILASGCHVIFTLKLPIKGDKYANYIITEVLEILDDSRFKFVNSIHLLQNTKFERTLYAVKL